LTTVSEGAQVSRRQQQKDATAQRLFEVAVALFLERGYHETTIEAIAAAAGVAKGTFFSHFVSKEAVLGHLGQIQVARLRAALAANRSLADQSFRDQVRFIFGTLGEYIEGQRELVLMTAIEILRQRDMAQSEMHGIGAFDQMLLPLVQRAQQRGELRRDATAEEIAALIRSLYFMSVFEWLRQEERPFVEVAARQLDLLLDGLQAR
jgi:AcrR family transcriptional regulator